MAPCYLPRPANVNCFAKPYWEYTRKHELRVQKCQGCGELYYPVNPVCPHCLHIGADWAKLSGEGTVYSFIIARRPCRLTTAPSRC